MKCPVCGRDGLTVEDWIEGHNRAGHQVLYFHAKCPHCSFNHAFKVQHPGHLDFEKIINHEIKQTGGVKRWLCLELTYDDSVSSIEAVNYGPASLSGLAEEGLLWIENPNYEPIKDESAIIANLRDFESESEVYKWCRDNIDEFVDIVPIRGIEHGGLYITGTTYGGYPDARWEGVLVGIAVVTRDFLQNHFGDPDFDDWEQIEATIIEAAKVWSEWTGWVLSVEKRAELLNKRFVYYSEHFGFAAPYDDPGPAIIEILKDDPDLNLSEDQLKSIVSKLLESYTSTIEISLD